MIEASSHHTHIARKPHKCSYCNGIIPAGTKYNRDGVVNDGTAYTWKSHLICQELVDRLVDWNNVDDGVDDNYFHEMIYQSCRNIIDHHPDKMKLSEMIDVVTKYYKIKEGGQL